MVLVGSLAGPNPLQRKSVGAMFVLPRRRCIVLITGGGLYRHMLMPLLPRLSLDRRLAIKFPWLRVLLVVVRTAMMPMLLTWSVRLTTWLSLIRLVVWAMVQHSAMGRLAFLMVSRLSTDRNGVTLALFVSYSRGCAMGCRQNVFTGLAILICAFGWVRLVS